MPRKSGAIIALVVIVIAVALVMTYPEYSAKVKDWPSEGSDLYKFGIRVDMSGGLDLVGNDTGNINDYTVTIQDSNVEVTWEKIPYTDYVASMMADWFKEARGTPIEGSATVTITVTDVDTGEGTIIFQATQKAIGFHAFTAWETFGPSESTSYLINIEVYHIQTDTIVLDETWKAVYPGEASKLS